MPKLKKLESSAAYTPSDGEIVEYFAEEAGQIVLKVKKSDGTEQTLSGGGGGGGGSMDFFQCTAIYGPKTVSGFIVAGAGTTAVNGNYAPTELTTEEGGIIYKHETAEYYYFEMWGEKGICNSPTDYPSSGLYYNMYDEGWQVGTGAADAPTVTAGTVTINADVPKTWDGNRAVYTEADGYTFEDTVTTGLVYGGGLVPEVGKIYNADAKILVSKLFETVKPITTNDTSCLIYIDGTSLTNQALAPNKHDVTFGSGVAMSPEGLVLPADDSGRITTQARIDGFGGSLTEWTWDFYFLSDASMLDCSGHSSYGWVLEAQGNGDEIYFRGQNTSGKTLGVTYTQNELVGLSMQWDNGILHVWNKGKYVGTCTPTFADRTGKSFGIGCDYDSGMERSVDNIKLFRFSNKARYTPGVDFELPEGFI